MARTAGSTAEETRGRILAAARDLFAERGYASASIRDIADLLGMTKAALYYHFPAKQDVLEALVAPLLDGIDAIAETARRQSPVDREEALRAFVGLMTGPDAPLWALLSDPSAVKEAARRLDARRRVTRLTQALAGGGGPASVLAVRCALGAAHSGIVGTVADHTADRSGDPDAAPGAEETASPAAPRAPGRTLVTDQERETIIEAALRAWSVDV